MFNDISISKLGVTQQNTPTSTNTPSKTEESSIFGNNLIEDKEPVKLTKEEKQAIKAKEKAEKKAKKEAEKAERERIKNIPDGIIQGGKQGSAAGDCWLLAQMNSMAKTEWGKEALKNGITKEDDGSFTVHFKGVGKDISISQKEFEKAQRNSEYSSGDADALLYEVATEKYYKENNKNGGTIKGNGLAGDTSLQYLLTKTPGRQITEGQDEVIETVLKTMGKSPKDNAGFSATYIYEDKSPDSTGNVNHAVSIQQVILNDKGEVDEVVLLDSYKPDSPYKVSFSQFMHDKKAFGFARKTN